MEKYSWIVQSYCRGAESRTRAGRPPDAHSTVKLLPVVLLTRT